MLTGILRLKSSPNNISHEIRYRVFSRANSIRNRIECVEGCVVLKHLCYGDLSSNLIHALNNIDRDRKNFVTRTACKKTQHQRECQVREFQLECFFTHMMPLIETT